MLSLDEISMEHLHAENPLPTPLRQKAFVCEYSGQNMVGIFVRYRRWEQGRILHAFHTR